MNNIKPLLFLFPVIFIILTIILYFAFLVKARDKKTFKKLVFITTFFAFVLNFAWEIIQIPLYKDSSYSLMHITFCALAAVADAMAVLLIYLVFGFIFKDLLWIQKVTWNKALLIIAIGGIGAALMETWYLSLANWSYADAMPVIPVVKVGLSPMLQFMILPLLIYRLSLISLNE